MYKKIISVMSVMLVVFLCFNYDVKADEVIDSSRRYNWLSTTQHYGNVDVTGNLFCLSDNPAMQSVNLSSAEYVGGGTTQSVVSTWESVYLWKFQATFVLKNTGDTYETFDNGRLYSQFSVTAKASTSSSGSGSLTDDVVPSGWYIDNIQGATLTNALSDGTMYWSVDDTYYGNTLIIAPGQSITFSYDINIFWWEQSFGVGGTTFACQNGSISNTIGYTQQDGYNSYSVYEFITDYPFPSVEQYVADNITNIYTLCQTMVSQNTLTNNELSDILDAITYTGNYPNYIVASNTMSNTSRTINNVLIDNRMYRGTSSIIDHEIVYDAYNDTYNDIYSLSIPVIYFVRLVNNNNYPVVLGSSDSISLTCNNDFVIDNVIGDIGIFKSSVSNFAIRNIYIDANDTNNYVIIGHINYVGSNSEYTVPLANVISVGGNFTKYDPNNSVNSTEDQVHQQEQNYYSNTNTAIGNTGLDNFSFNQQESGGLSGVSDDFVRVWNACGSLNSVWVFSLTLSLALYIIHHVPRQRSQ